MTKWLPWGFTLLFAMVAMLGWKKAFNAQAALEKAREHLQFSAPLTAPKVQSPSTIDSSGQPSIPKPPPRKPSSNAQASALALWSESIPDHLKPLSSKVSTCLQNPVVKDLMLAKADSLAKIQTEEALNDKRDEGVEKVHDYLDRREEVISNALNTYIEEAELEEGAADQLHTIIQDGFNMQRDILARFQSEELTEEQAKKLGQETHESNKKAVVELLGRREAGALKEIIVEEFKE